MAAGPPVQWPAEAVAGSCRRHVAHATAGISIDPKMPERRVGVLPNTKRP